MAGARSRGAAPAGTRLGLARVHGASMEPTLSEGDRLLVRHGAPVRPGDVVVARFADGTLAVKRAEGRRRTRTDDDGWWLTSDDPVVGVDSRHRGPVPDEAVLAVALLRLWPRPRWLRGRRRPVRRTY